MNSWHTVGVKYTKQFTDGTLKRVSEKYLVNSISFTDAEARIHQEVGGFVRGEFMVTTVTKTDFADIFHYDDAEVWFKCKVAYVSEDLDSGKEKKINNNFLVSAHNVKEAYERIEESLKGLMVSYEISKVETTKILEIFPYVAMEGEELVADSDETLHTSSFESEHEEQTNESYSAPICEDDRIDEIKKSFTFIDVNNEIDDYIKEFGIKRMKIVNDFSECTALSSVDGLMSVWKEKSLLNKENPDNPIEKNGYIDEFGNYFDIE